VHILKADISILGLQFVLKPIQNVYILTNKNVWFMMVFTIMDWIWNIDADHYVW
jgi:hypothetical protein